MMAILSPAKIFSSTCLIGAFELGGSRRAAYPGGLPLRLLARSHSCCWLLALQTTSHPPSLLTIVGLGAGDLLFGFNFGLCKRRPSLAILPPPKIRAYILPPPYARSLCSLPDPFHPIRASVMHGPWYPR